MIAALIGLAVLVLLVGSPVVLLARTRVARAQGRDVSFWTVDAHDGL